MTESMTQSAQIRFGMDQYGGSERVAEQVDKALGGSKVATIYAEPDSDTFLELGTEEEKEIFSELSNELYL